MTFITSLRSEFLKTKRTSIIYLILIAAFVVPFVLVFDHDLPDDGNPANGWNHFYEDGFKVFAFIFIPFFFIMATTLLMQIEVKNHAWKQVLASPQSFFHILLAKFLMVQVLALAFIIVFNVYMMMGCALIDLIFEVNYLAYVNRWPELLKLNLMAWGSNVGISALSFWLALRYKNFIAPIAIGFLLWLIGPTAALELKWPYFDKYVFVLPFTIIIERFEGDRLFYQLLSLGYGVFFFSIAYLEFAMKRIQWRSLFNNKASTLSDDER
ncbi:MAG TPA: ABC transporter permease [Cyclobacteriaceae bacterium]